MEGFERPLSSGKNTQFYQDLNVESLITTINLFKSRTQTSLRLVNDVK